VERWDAGCGVDQLVGARVGVSGLEKSRTAALIRIRFLDETEYSVLLQGSEESVIVTSQVAPGSVIGSYSALGAEHILTGPDHLLFVLGLVLLITGRRRLVLTITSFTVGHSITLALATLGWLKLPSGPVEVAIALSLVAVASELARSADAEPGLLRRSPWLVAGGFGPFRPEWIAPGWSRLKATMLAVIGSVQDQWGPLPGDILAERLSHVPRLERATIEGSGHFLQMEEPVQVGRLILDFLAE